MQVASVWCCVYCRQGAVFLVGALHAWHSGGLYRNFPKQTGILSYSILCVHHAEGMMYMWEDPRCAQMWPVHLYGMCTVCISVWKVSDQLLHGAISLFFSKRAHIRIYMEPAQHNREGAIISYIYTYVYLELDRYRRVHSLMRFVIGN